MGFYSEQILPRMVVFVLGTKACGEQREKFLKDICGSVLEIGFGSGLNLPYYSSSVSNIYALDPDIVGRRLARQRLEACSIPVEFLEFLGEKYPLESSSLDAVVSTWTLCTIPDIEVALKEIKRVLKKEGKLFFLEHGLSPELRVAKWQNRLTPVQKRIAGGCHFNRKLDDLILSAGFKIASLENFYMKGPKIGSYMYRGVAVKTD